MATILRADGRQEPLQATAPTGLSLEQLQAAVGGYIEIVPYAGGWVVCHEAGRLRRLPVNRALPQFVGDVVLCGRDEVQ